MNQQISEILSASGIEPAATGAVDFSMWTGQYPFRGIMRSSLEDWRRLVEVLGIQLTIASPFEAIFWENNLDAYARTAEELAEEPRMEVWPVVRPGALYGLEKLLDRYQPRGIRLVPTYHEYHLYDDAVEPIMKLAAQRNLIVQVFTRIADERWHWMLHKPELSMHELEYLTSIYDKQPILVSGLNRPQSLAHRFAQHPHLYADISRVRGPVFAMETVLAEAPLDRLVFGSLWPIQIIEATLWQVTTGRIKAAARDRVLWDNAQTLLELGNPRR